MSLGLVLSCEHGGHRVPARYAPDFAGAATVLASHAGWDPGSASLARDLQRSLRAPLILSTTTRLLAELNRSAGHPQLFSKWVRHHAPDERERILARYWRPHRDAVEQAIDAAPERTVLHVSVHSFTPVWKGQARAIDVSLLYDPARKRERAFAGEWLAVLRAERPDLRLRRNRPYLGTSDGLTTHLRKLFPASRYLGLELEVSQALTLGAKDAWKTLRRQLVRSLRSAMEGHRG